MGTGRKQMIDMETLRKFCSTDPDRPSIQEPFARLQWTVATNGHVLIRVARFPDMEEGPHAPNTERVFSRFIDGPWRPANKVTLPALIEESAMCEACKGLGTLHDCPHCTCDCWDCGSTGAVTVSSDDRKSASIGPQPYALKYVRLIHSLPGLQLPKKPPKDGPVSFRFDGGEGLLMPLTWAALDHLDISL